MFYQIISVVSIISISFISWVGAATAKAATTTAVITTVAKITSPEIASDVSAGGSCKSFVKFKIADDKKSISIELKDWNILSKDNTTSSPTTPPSPSITSPSLSPKFIRKNCEIAIPIKNVKGSMVSFESLDWNGQVRLSSQEEVSFSSEYFFVDEKSSNQKFQHKWKGPIEVLTKWNETHSLGSKSNNFWSACGKDSIFRVHLSIIYRVKGKELSPSGSFTTTTTSQLKTIEKSCK